jgi:opacity protein-like surface antigen
MSLRLARGWTALGVVSGLVLLSGRAFAQDGDVLEDKDQADEPQQQNDSNDDGGWSSDEDVSEGSSESGFHLGLRLGFGFPMGESAKGTKLGHGILGQIPIWLDLGWQFNPHFMVGAYFSYGFVLLDSDSRDACDNAKIDCSASDIRLGAQVQYSFAPQRPVDPWIGAGLGYEWAHSKYGKASSTVRGWEIPMLQAGLDFGGDSGGSSFGPFVAYTIGTYTRYSDDQGSGDIPETASHSWLFLGIRGVSK